MTKIDINLTTRHRAALAAGRHLQRKDGSDALDIIAQKFNAHADVVADEIKGLRTELAGTKEHVLEMQQKAARVGAADYSPRTWGQQFVEADGLKSFAEEHGRPGRFRLELKDITSTPTSGGAMGQPFRDEVATLARRRLTIRDLLPVVAVSSNSVEWPSMTSRPDAAGTVAEGALKPKSDMTLELKNTPTQVVAHWVAASRQILDDAPQLRDLIDTELRHGLALVEEAQLLAGDGVAPNLHGLIPQATAFADPSGGTITPTNLIDQIALALLQAALADFPATGIIVHPSDWTRMRMTKDADGKYLMGAPASDIPPTLFGLPVVASQAIAAGSYLVGDFQQAATLYDRWTPRVEISTEHSDFFTRNLVAILAEQRIALAVRKPSALITGVFA